MDFFANFIGGTFDSLSSFYNSTTFAVIKFIAGIYAAVLFVDIVLLLIQRGLSGDLRDTMLGMNLPHELVKSKQKNVLRNRWDRIKGRLESGQQSEYKIAIIEADDLIDDLIRRMNYKGENFGERLANIKPGQIENLEDLKSAHLERNKIIHDGKLEITKEQAEQIMSAYEEFLRSFEVLD